MVEILSGLVFGTIQGCMTGGISFIVSIADILISIFYQILTALGCTGVGGGCAVGGGGIMGVIMSWVSMALGVLGLGGGGILGGGLGIIIDEIIVSIGTAVITIIRVIIDGVMGGLQMIGIF